MEMLYINGKRNGYTAKQCGKTLTVKELIKELKTYDGDLPVYLCNDNGRTYGSITDGDIFEWDEE